MTRTHQGMSSQRRLPIFPTSPSSSSSPHRHLKPNSSTAGYNGAASNSRPNHLYRGKDTKYANNSHHADTATLPQTNSKPRLSLLQVANEKLLESPLSPSTNKRPPTIRFRNPSVDLVISPSVSGASDPSIDCAVFSDDDSSPDDPDTEDLIPDDSIYEAPISYDEIDPDPIPNSVTLQSHTVLPMSNTIIPNHTVNTHGPVDDSIDSGIEPSMERDRHEESPATDSNFSRHLSSDNSLDQPVKKASTTVPPGSTFSVDGIDAKSDAEDANSNSNDVSHDADDTSDASTNEEALDDSDHSSQVTPRSLARDPSNDSTASAAEPNNIDRAASNIQPQLSEQDSMTKDDADGVDTRRWSRTSSHDSVIGRNDSRRDSKALETQHSRSEEDIGDDGAIAPVMAQHSSDDLPGWASQQITRGSQDGPIEIGGHSQESIQKDEESRDEHLVNGDDGHNDNRQRSIAEDDQHNNDSNSGIGHGTDSRLSGSPKLHPDRRGTETSIDINESPLAHDTTTNNLNHNGHEDISAVPLERITPTDNSDLVLIGHNEPLSRRTSNDEPRTSPQSRKHQSRNNSASKTSNQSNNIGHQRTTAHVSPVRPVIAKPIQTNQQDSQWTHRRRSLKKNLAQNGQASRQRSRTKSQSPGAYRLPPYSNSGRTSNESLNNSSSLSTSKHRVNIHDIFGLTDETAAKRRSREQWLNRKKQEHLEKEQKEKEQKKQEAEAAYQAWLRKKDEQRKRAKSMDRETTADQARKQKEAKRLEAEAAFRGWLDRKRQDQIEKRKRQIAMGIFPTTDYTTSNQAAYSWKEHRRRLSKEERHTQVPIHPQIQTGRSTLPRYRGNNEDNNTSFPRLSNIRTISPAVARGRGRKVAT